MKVLLKILLISFLLSGSIFATDCVKICEKFLSCTEELNQRKATPAEKTKLNENCAKTCMKKTAQISGCFANNSGSCQTYAQCIINLVRASSKK